MEQRPLTVAELRRQLAEEKAARATEVQAGLSAMVEQAAPSAPTPENEAAPVREPEEPAVAGPVAETVEPVSEPSRVVPERVKPSAPSRGDTRLSWDDVEKRYGTSQTFLPRVMVEDLREMLMTHSETDTEREVFEKFSITKIVTTFLAARLGYALVDAPQEVQRAAELFRQHDPVMARVETTVQRVQRVSLETQKSLRETRGDMVRLVQQTDRLEHLVDYLIADSFLHLSRGGTKPDTVDVLNPAVIATKKAVAQKIDGEYSRQQRTEGRRMR